METRDRRAAGAEKIRAQFGGRDALFGVSGTLPRIVELRLESVRLNPNQPRKTINEDGLRDLAASIEQHGLIQPITVQRLPDDDAYMVVAGERRLRAFQLLGRETVPAILTTGNADEIAIIENLQREDLRPLEEAEALAALKERHGYTQEELARVVAKAKSTISELLALNDLPAALKEEVRTSELPLSKSILIEIARLKTEQEQVALWERAKAAGGVTVRAARTHKQTGRMADHRSELAKTVSAGRSFVRKIGRLPPAEVVVNREYYEELLRIREELEELLARCREAGVESEGQSPNA
jgi:ParB family transcriptional regulator, chromosome partitioning protein